MPVQGPQTRVPADNRGVRSFVRKREHIETGVQNNRINRRRRSALSSNIEIDSTLYEHYRPISVICHVLNWTAFNSEGGISWYIHNS